MLANFFGKSNPVNFIVVFLVFLGYYIANFFIVNPIQFFDINVILNQLLTVILFLFLFLFYNFILIKNKLTLSNSYGLLLFALFFGFYPAAFFYEEFLASGVIKKYTRKFLIAVFGWGSFSFLIQLQLFLGC
jgi:hypothetical protein